MRHVLLSFSFAANLCFPRLPGSDNSTANSRFGVCRQKRNFASAPVQWRTVPRADSRRSRGAVDGGPLNPRKGHVTYVFADARQRRGQQEKKKETTAQTVADPNRLARQVDGLRGGM